MQMCVSWDFRRDYALLSSKFDYLIKEKNVHTSLDTHDIFNLLIVSLHFHSSFKVKHKFYQYPI